MLQLLHISDLHLFVPGSLHKDLLELKRKGFPYKQLSQFYTYAWGPAKTALRKALRRVAGQEPALLLLTGDIAALPYDSASEVEQEYYGYVDSLLKVLPSSSEMLIVLGNHDWNVTSTTPFQGTSFDGVHKVLGGLRAAYFSVAGQTVLLFLVDTTRTILPATGSVEASMLATLSSFFQNGQRGQLPLGKHGQLSAGTYRDAVKVLLLHHYALPWTAYLGKLRWWDHRTLQLENRSELLVRCRGQIDLFFFGHSHVPVQRPQDGFIMIDTGSTLGAENISAPPDAQFQRLLIYDRDLVEVESYRWNEPRSDFMLAYSRRCQRTRTGHWS